MKVTTEMVLDNYKHTHTHTHTNGIKLNVQLGKVVRFKACDKSPVREKANRLCKQKPASDEESCSLLSGPFISVRTEKQIGR